MRDVDDMVAWYRAQLDEDERIAVEASRDHRGRTPAGEHWHWVETEHDQPVTLDPVVDEFVADGSVVALRSVEEYPTGMPYTLPHFVVPTAEEVPTVCGMHIARWDPARVLAEVKAKRQVLEWIHPVDRTGMGPTLLGTLAAACADRPGYREEWRP